MAVLSIRDFPDELLHRAKKLALDGRVSLKAVVIVALTKLTNGEEKVITPEDNVRDASGSSPTPKKSKPSNITPEFVETPVSPAVESSDPVRAGLPAGYIRVTHFPSSKCRQHGILACVMSDCCKIIRG